MSDWSPSASIEALKQRQALMQRLRDFFQQRHFLEVDVPILNEAGSTDPHLQSFRCDNLYLQTSPEFFLKRLLCAGSGPVYAIAKAFRREESGRYHQREFCLLEWYQPGFDDHQLMQQMGELLSAEIDLPIKKISYQNIFQQHCQLNPHTAALEVLQNALWQEAEIRGKNEGRDFYLDALFSFCVQPKLQDAIYFVHDYPASQAALAKITNNGEGIAVARRFEVFINGVELANGYWELTDAEEQRQRFVADNEKRRAVNLEDIPFDEKLIAALKAGMPECAGVALGLDRLLMILLGKNHIDDVVSFSA